MSEQLACLIREFKKTPVQLARRVNVKLANKGEPDIHPTAAYRWIKGSKPRGVIPELVAEVLSEWASRKITLRDLGWNQVTYSSSLEVIQGPWVPSEVVQILQTIGADVDRATYLEQGGLELASLAAPWLLDPIEQLEDSIDGSRINVAVADDIDTITATRRRMDDSLGGGGNLLPALREDIKLTIKLIKSSRYDTLTGQRLLSCAAEQLRLASWLAYDTGAYGLSQHYTATALRAAHAAQDRQVGANILGFAAYQAGTRGDVVAAESLSRSALAGGRGMLTPAVEGSLHARLGMARARLGDASGASAAFAAADEFLARSEPEAEPRWIYWFTPADKDGIAGESYLAGGRTDLALAHLRSAADGTPEEFTRDKALWLSTMATAYATAGEGEQGRETAEQALTLLGTDLESERVFGVFDGFCNALRGHDQRAADDFHDRLVAHVAEGDELN